MHYVKLVHLFKAVNSFYQGSPDLDLAEVSLDFATFTDHRQQVALISVSHNDTKMLKTKINLPEEITCDIEKRLSVLNHIRMPDRSQNSNFVNRIVPISFTHLCYFHFLQSVVPLVLFPFHQEN